MRAVRTVIAEGTRCFLVLASVVGVFFLADDFGLLDPLDEYGATGFTVAGSVIGAAVGALHAALFQIPIMQPPRTRGSKGVAERSLPCSPALSTTPSPASGA